MAKKTTKQVTAVQASDPVTRGVPRKMTDADRTPEDRIELVRGYLDKMEAIQLQHATGAILIGMELLALKEEVGHGAFTEIFEKQIERPRFSYRSAARYMQDAARIQKRIAKTGNTKLLHFLDVAPSDMSVAVRRELTEVIGNITDGRNLSDLRGALGARNPPQLTEGAEKGSGEEAELAAHARCWQELCKRLTEAAVHRKTWKFLNADTRRIVREQVKLSLDNIPEA